MTPEDDLRKLLSERPTKVVLLVGPDVTADALRGSQKQVPTSTKELLASGLSFLRDSGQIDEDLYATQIGLLDHEKVTVTQSVAAVVEAELKAPSGGEFRKWLRSTFEGLRHEIQDSGVLEALKLLQARGVLLATTNYDTLLSDVSEVKSLTWHEFPKLERVLREEERCTLHLHGRWDSPESVVLGLRSYDAVIRDKHVGTVLKALRTTRTFVFLGYGSSINDPHVEAFLQWCESVFAESEYRHFILCRDSEVNEIRQRHPPGQRIFPVPYGETTSDLAAFLGAPSETMTASRPDDTSPGQHPAARSQGRVVPTRSRPKLFPMMFAIVTVIATFAVGTYLFFSKPSDVDQAKAAYLATIDAYNRDDPELYYSGFAPQLDCFYKVKDADIRKWRKKFSGSVQVEQLKFLRMEGTDRVLLCDRGFYDKHDGRSRRTHNKAIVMQKIAGEWKIVIETTREQSECFRSPC